VKANGYHTLRKGWFQNLQAVNNRGVCHNLTSNKTARARHALDESSQLIIGQRQKNKFTSFTNVVWAQKGHSRQHRADSLAIGARWGNPHNAVSRPGKG